MADGRAKVGKGLGCWMHVCCMCYVLAAIKYFIECMYVVCVMFLLLKNILLNNMNIEQIVCGYKPQRDRKAAISVAVLP